MLDLFSRRGGGWATSNRLKRGLAVETHLQGLDAAIKTLSQFNAEELVQGGALEAFGETVGLGVPTLVRR